MGCIGGWTIGSNCLCSNNLVLSSCGSIRTGNFVSGNAGWCISCNGSAEFANASIRGTLHSTVF
jgi:hypothetical protein